MTVRYSVDFLILQRKSWTKWELATVERRVKWGELVEDGESQWRNLERTFGFVKLEKTVSVHLQAAWLKESSLVIIESNRRTGKVCVALCGKWWLQNCSWRRKSQLTKKERDPHCQGLWLKECQRLNQEDSTSCLRTLKLTDTREAVQDVQRVHRMEKRQSHIMTNAQSESERSLRERWQEKQGWMRTKTESPRQSEWKRGKELELIEVEGVCLVDLKTEIMSRWRFDRRTHLAVASEKTSTKRTGWETSTLTKEDQWQQVKNNLTSWGRQYDLSKKLRPSAAASSDTTVALEFLASGETQDRLGSVFV